MYIEPKYTNPIIHPKHIVNKIDHFDTNDLPIHPLFQSKRHINIFKDNPEFTIENEMSRKRGIDNYYQQRNYIHCCSPGDKKYNEVQYSPDFFKLEGLVVGSTNRLRIKKNTSIADNNFYTHMNINLKLLDQNKIWKNKIKHEQLESQKDYVKNLLKFDNNVLGLQDKEEA